MIAGGHAVITGDQDGDQLRSGGNLGRSGVNRRRQESNRQRRGGSRRRPNGSRRRLKSNRLRPCRDHRISARNRRRLAGGLQTGGRDRPSKGIPEFERIGVKIDKGSEVGQWTDNGGIGRRDRFRKRAGAVRGVNGRDEDPELFKRDN